MTEAARILGYSQDTVRRMIEDGELIGWRARRGGRKFLMYRAQVKDVASRAQAQAVQYARDMQQLTLPL
ncbi:excisionase family DNA-binding protein [Akkermansia sp. JRP_AM1]|uniref:excisionase family DNA-binding protein n=1 Tax=Akkermansia sp. JRP_AM1 TaxID=3414159 RepID=UPI003BFA6E01